MTSLRSLGFRLIALIAAFGATPSIGAAGDPEVIILPTYLQGEANGLLQRWGICIAIDGDTLIAGATDGVFVATKTSGRWSIQQELASFGSKVGFGVDVWGDTAVAGGPLDSTIGAQAGKAVVWERQGTSWSQTATLFASDAQSDDEFGDAVSVYGDWIAVGATGVANHTGAVYVFERVGTDWIERDKLLSASPNIDEDFGGAVELGPTTLACGHRRTATGLFNNRSPGPGGVTLFDLAGGSWTQTLELQPPVSPLTSGFGTALAFDGDRLAVGALGEAPAGVAYVFDRSGGSWSQVARIAAPDSTRFWFGRGIDLDGNQLAIGGWETAYLYQEDATGEWHAAASFLPGIFGCEFGHDVALEDGSLHVSMPNAFRIGIFDDNGAVFPAEVSPGPVPYCAGKMHSQNCAGRMDWCGLPRATNGLEFRLTASETIALRPGILFYGFAPTALPFLGGTLCVQPPLRRTPPDQALGDGTPCSGTYDFDFQSLIDAQSDPGLVAGADVFAQFWHRDPGDAFGVGLTDGINFSIWP